MFLLRLDKFVVDNLVMAKIGRPSLYSSNIIVRANNYLKESIPENMSIPTVEGMALKLGVSRDTLYEWAKKHKDFSDTIKELKMRQKEALIRIGIFGGKEINATIVALLLKVNHKMVETTKTNITSNNKVLVMPSELKTKYGI